MLHVRFGLFTLTFSGLAFAGTHEKVEVTGRRYSWLDTVQTASEGQVNREQLQERPILRPGEILESVPGLITTQHSGTGKANQYFLRGFNLDHGTDFATFVDGIPINMPSHGHGQGYTDINFLIPELLDRVEYAKGPYSAAYGDFSGAGHVDMRTMDVFPYGLLKYTYGSYDYHRLLALDSIEVGDKDHLSYAIEGTRYKGPWSDIDERLRKAVVWAKYVHLVEEGQHTITAQHYNGSWNSADQIPERAVKEGILNRLGTVDKTAGGETQRDSLSWIYDRKVGEGGSLRAQLYGVGYKLKLWSNFGFYLDDPVNGDQFEQVDQRTIVGATIAYSQKWSLGEVPGILRVGVQDRYDRIGKVGLYKTIARERLDTFGEASIRENQIGTYVEQEWHWTPNFRSTLGLRNDQVSFVNQNEVTDEERTKTAQLTSPKFSIGYKINPSLQVFASAGQSFHSNDARGVTSKDSPAPGFAPVRGYEVGSSYESNDTLRMSLAVWRLNLDSELVYIGDVGTTEASRGSRREGVDWLLQVAPDPKFHADLELSWARARFNTDPDGEGVEVEGHLPFVAMFGLGSQLTREWEVSARLRHFGKRPLTSDGSRKSDPTSVLNLHAVYERDGWEWALDGLNALNTKDHDIDYYYESRLQGEAEAVSDLHFHPVEPASIRMSLARHF